MAADDNATALERFGVDESTLTKTLEEVLGRQVDDADLFFEHIQTEGIGLEQGIVKRASRSIRQGVGVRAVSGERTGYAHSDEIDGRQLLEAARAALVVLLDAWTCSGHVLDAASAHAALLPCEAARADFVSLEYHLNVARLL